MSSSHKLKIPLEEISSATNDFAEANIIGRGGYGIVYKGQSKQHGMLAIKRLNRVLGQGDHEYGMEVSLLSKYKHENLVSLIGFCGEGGEKILVYKYEANKSLDKFLHSKDLSWMRRLQICLGAARGLRYLHNETVSGSGVIHRDIKSSNILLDENWNAKISDFGLSKIGLTSSANSVIFTGACGTPGYVDPEYLLDCTLTQKSDVYSFGIVMYEVLFGKLVATPRHPGDRPFTAKTARELYQTKTLHKMIDPDLEIQINSNSLSVFSSMAYECLKNLREDRPTMSSVVEALEKALSHQQVSGIENFRPSSSKPLEKAWGYQQVSTTESYRQSTSGFLNDVYISFRSEPRDNVTYIVESLCYDLKKEGLSIFKDNLSSNDDLLLLSAIKQTRSFIIIFSKNFATNSWNMDEVAEIVKCVKERGNVVLPIFLDVHPAEVREQKGLFGKAMSKYDTHPSIKVWRNALVEATNVSGLQASEFRYYEDLTKEAVARIKAKSSQSKSTRPSISRKK